MSDTPGSSDNDSGKNPFQLIVDNEDEILAAFDLIDTCLEENLVKADRDVRRYLVVRDLSGVLLTEIPDEDLTDDIARSLMGIISSGSTLNVQSLRKLDASKDLMRGIAKLCSKYGAESSKPNRRSTQGSNYWTDIHLDLVKRARSEAIGMNYEVVLRHEYPVDISMDLDSNLAFCRNLLNAQVRAIDTFEEEAANQMDDYWLEDLQQQLNQLESLLETHRDSEDTKNNDN